MYGLLIVDSPDCCPVFSFDRLILIWILILPRFHFLPEFPHVSLVVVFLLLLLLLLHLSHRLVGSRYLRVICVTCSKCTSVKFARLSFHLCSRLVFPAAIAIISSFRKDCTICSISNVLLCLGLYDREIKLFSMIVGQEFQKYNENSSL